MPELADAGWVAPFGGTLPEFDPKELIEPRKSIKVMSHDIQMASAAAELAWQEAGLADAALDAERFGVLGAAGIMYCDLEELRDSVLEWLKQEDFDIHRWSRIAMGELYPLWMLKYLPNMPACHIGIRYDARGPNNTIASGNVSSILALSEAADCIRRDHADVMIVAGTGSRINISWAHMALCGPHGAATESRSGRGLPTVRRRAQRHGLRRRVGRARARKPRACRAPRSEIARPHCGVRQREAETTADWSAPTGDAIRRTIRAALASAGMKAEDFGHVNAHGIQHA